MRKVICTFFAALLCVLLIGTVYKTIHYFPEDYAETAGGLRNVVTTLWGALRETKLCERAIGHDAWIDLYGLFLKATGVDVIPDEDRAVYRMRNGSLSFLKTCASDFTADERDAIKQVRSAADRVGAECWFVGVPRKPCIWERDVFSARGVEDPFAARVPVFESAFTDAGYQMLDLHARMHAVGMDHSGSYYRTDHHWKTETVFWAAREIAAALGLDDAIPDISQFETETYPGIFLGSEGKHCGRLYCPPDDFVLYLPKFETDFTTTPFDGSPTRSGSFRDSLLFMERLNDQISPYENNPYTVFIGGDTSRKIVNRLCPDGKHIVFFKDSFANSVAPYLALGCRQIDLIDPRNYDTVLSDYIEEVRPDIVCIMLSPCMGNHYFKTS